MLIFCDIQIQIIRVINYRCVKVHILLKLCAKVAGATVA